MIRVLLPLITLITLGLFRSVICDGDGNILCFSPPKSIDVESFKEKTSMGNCEIQEFSEGTMVNMYFRLYLL